MVNIDIKIVNSHPFFECQLRMPMWLKCFPQHQLAYFCVSHGDVSRVRITRFCHWPTLVPPKEAIVVVEIAI